MKIREMVKQKEVVYVDSFFMTVDQVMISSRGEVVSGEVVKDGQRFYVVGLPSSLILSKEESMKRELGVGCE